MYTVMIGDDGMFSAEYVVPPALSIPLGTSGSTVDVVRNEDGTFSADGEVITAETRVTAANGNVYAAVLSPEGVPVSAMHVAAMQDVMLGELGGTVKLTQAEDMSWWLGETAVADGSVHTHASGNMYTLMLDSEGMWSAMYQKVEVLVDLGTQGPVTLERAEDMSWWLASEAVDVGSEVNSPNGNTYTLWYTDGVWSAQFEPESMMIEGTGLVAMTREGDDMYDVGDSTLEATGMGDVIDGDAMYHVWMQDDALMGARFDAAIDAGNHTRMKIGLGNPVLSADDSDTPGNELRTHIILTGDDDNGKGMFSFADLLGSGMASDQGATFIDNAVEEIEKVQAYVSALLALDTPLSGLGGILDEQWKKIEAALDIFNNSQVVDAKRPREEDFLNDIDAILAALSSEDAFVAATAKDGDGVFAGLALDAGGARDRFNRLTWIADATLGATGSTRYGTVARKVSDHAAQAQALSRGEHGAFSYSTMQETVRTADAAAVRLTGIATYTGGTRAVSGSGKTYSGTMDLQVRFRANTVSGLVSGLEDSDGLPWQHNFADVAQIVLGDGTLRRNAKWVSSGEAANVFYAANSGLLRPARVADNTFDGILLGRGENAGSEANGTWSVGTGTTRLAGGFGVVHSGNVTRPQPTDDNGAEAAAMLYSMADTNQAVNMTKASIADGVLTVKQRTYGWRDHDGNDSIDYGPLSEDYGPTADDDDDTNPTLLTAKFDLVELAEKGAGGTITQSGPTWVDEVVSTLTTEREVLSALQGLKSADTLLAEGNSWKRVQNALQYKMLGNLPMKMAEAYDAGEAIDLINRALEALESNANLKAALDPEGTGIFDHYGSGEQDDPTTEDTREDQANFVNEAKTKVYDRRTFDQMRKETTHKVIATLGTTSFTRFGAWRRESTRSAVQTAGQDEDAVIDDHGGPGTFAYSQLDPTNVGTPTNPAFPRNGRASYTGETVAFQAGTPLTGTVRADVSWKSLADADNGLNLNGTGIAEAGMMSLTISDLASAEGDPLSHAGTVAQDDGTGGNRGNEIADIVLGGFKIVAGDEGANLNHMVVGMPDTTKDPTYAEIAPTSARLRFPDSGMPDEAGVPGLTLPSETANGASVKALFVGHGVDGPLGVIGTWTVRHEQIGRVSPDGTGVVGDSMGAIIYGAFGAEAP